MARVCRVTFNSRALISTLRWSWCRFMQHHSADVGAFGVDVRERQSVGLLYNSQAVTVPHHVAVLPMTTRDTSAGREHVILFTYPVVYGVGDNGESCLILSFLLWRKKN